METKNNSEIIRPTIKNTENGVKRNLEQILAEGKFSLTKRREPKTTNSLGRLEILLAIIKRWFDGFLTWFPSSRAYLTVLISELECLHQAKSFINTTSHREIIDSDLTQILFWVNNKQSTEGDSSVFLKYIQTKYNWNNFKFTIYQGIIILSYLQHSVSPRNFTRFVRKQWDVHISKTPLFTRLTNPVISN